MPGRCFLGCKRSRGSARTPITREGTAARSCCGRRECRGSPLHGEYCWARQSRSVRSSQKLALRRKGPARALPRRAAEETTRQATGEGERRQSQGDCCDERDMSHVRQNGRGQEKVPHGNEARCRNNQKAKPAEMVHRDGLLVIALRLRGEMVTFSKDRGSSTTKLLLRFRPSWTIRTRGLVTA